MLRVADKKKDPKPEDKGKPEAKKEAPKDKAETPKKPKTPGTLPQGSPMPGPEAPMTPDMGVPPTPPPDMGGMAELMAAMGGAGDMAGGPDKLEQAKVVYLTPDQGPFACGNCVYWEEPNACALVSGFIDPGGMCNLFTSAGNQAPPMGLEAPAAGLGLEAGLEGTENPAPEAL